MVALADRERTNRCFNFSDDVNDDARPFASISNYLSSHVGPSVVLLLATQYDRGSLIITKAAPKCRNF